MDDRLNETIDGHAPESVDLGLAFAYGEKTVRRDPAGVLDSIRAVTGGRPSITLRPASLRGNAPVLKPLRPGDEVGRNAGKYLVHGLIGRGGMGTVHKGFDTDLGREVAMKFLHERHRDEPDVLHRFVEEAQIGGQLQHPGIVPVYELGMADGRPFFTMELVEGQTLAERLTDRATPRDDLQRFLSIFEDVCQTMAYAHARGVVHRDLKPANIMIGSFGEVQVVDWGMGKVLERGGCADEERATIRHLRDAKVNTVRSGTESIAGSVMGTPAYMPPEQARGDVEAMDARSDVFALGAILCEILTGQPPYVGSKDALLALAASGRQDDAHTRLAASGAEQALVELATRCLAPAPEERPASAEAVARSVHDHLAGVESRVQAARLDAAEARGRAASLGRQRRLGVALIATITAGLAATLWLWRDAQAQRELAVAAAGKERLATRTAEAALRKAETQARLAAERAAQLQEVTAFQARQLGGIAPEQMGARLRAAIVEAAPRDEQAALQARLDRIDFTGIGLDAMHANVFEPALAAIDRDFGGQPLVQARLLQSLAATMRELGLLAAATAPQTRALEIRARELGDDHEDTLASVGNAASLLVEQGRYDAAEARFRDLVARASAALGADDPLTLSARSDLGMLLWRQGALDEAETLCRDVLADRRRVLGDDHEATLGSLTNLGSVLATRDKAAAESCYREAVDRKRAQLGDDHPLTLTAIHNLGQLLGDQGRFADAEPLVREALAGDRRVFGNDHPRTLNAAHSLGGLLLEQRKLEAAEPLLREALEGRRRVLGRHHPETLSSLCSLGNLLQQRGELDAAEAMFREAVDSATRTHGADHTAALDANYRLCLLLQERGALDVAEPLARSVLAGLRRARGDEHEKTLDALINLGLLLVLRGRPDDAGPILDEAVRTAREVLGPDHKKTLDALNSLGRLRASQGKLDEAEALYGEAVGGLRRLRGDRHPDTLVSIHNLGQLLVRRGELEAAAPLVREAFEGFRAAFRGADNAMTLFAAQGMFNLLRAQGKLEAAETALHELLATAGRVLGDGAPFTRRTRVMLLSVQLERSLLEEDTAAARDLLQRVGVLSPDDAGARVALAWELLGRGPEAKRAMGAALSLAQQAEAFAAGTAAGPLQVLAEAQFASGEVDAARATMQRALEAPIAPGDRDAAWMRTRLDHYASAGRR